MPISYQKLFNILQKNGWTTYRIRKEKLIGQGTLSALKNGTGGLDSKTIARICKVLNCQPGDLMEYIPNNEQEQQGNTKSPVPAPTSSAANISKLPQSALELQKAAPPVAQEVAIPKKQEKKYKTFTEADINRINLQELLTNIKYQLDIADSYGTEVLSSLLEKARQQAAEANTPNE